jgi:hypothetical protein
MRGQAEAAEVAAVTVVAATAVAVERRTPWVVAAADTSAVVDASAAAECISAVRHAWVVARVWAAAACISGGDLMSEAAATSAADLVSVLFITVADRRDRDRRHGPVSTVSAPSRPMVTELAVTELAAAPR